mgnify:CR=1 FL=1
MVRIYIRRILMLTYSFTNLKNESLYMHLYQCIRQDIVDGKLVSGEKLPSKRSFAAAKCNFQNPMCLYNLYYNFLSFLYCFSSAAKSAFVASGCNAFIASLTFWVISSTSLCSVRGLSSTFSASARILSRPA